MMPTLSNSALTEAPRSMPQDTVYWPQSLKSSTVAHVIGSPKLGGAEQLAISLAAEQQRRGGRLELWAPRKGPAEAAALAANLTVNRGFVTRDVAATPFATLAANFRSLVKALKTNKPILHFHCPILYALLSRSLEWTSAITILHVHIELPLTSYAWICRRPPHAIVTCAKFLADQVHDAIGEAQGSSPHVLALPNAVDLDRFRPPDEFTSRGDEDDSTHRPVALLTGNLSPHKGQATAIKAVSELAKRGNSIELWLAGVEREETGYTRKLEQLASELGVRHQVRFLGFRDDVEHLIRAANTLLLPSKHEGLPLSILEAQASRIPVVAAPVAGIPEIIQDGKTGWLVEPDDVEGYAQAIANLLSQPSKTRAVTQAAYENIQANHSWRRYVDKTVELYCSLLPNPA